MQKPKMPWFKLYSYEWLEGSIRRDLTGAERAVWADLLSLANMSRRRGYIERSEGIPYALDELADKFKESIEVVESAVEKCLKEGRLSKDGYGSLVVTNWEKYQFVSEKKKSVRVEKTVSFIEEVGGADALPRGEGE